MLIVLPRISIVPVEAENQGQLHASIMYVSDIYMQMANWSLARVDLCPLQLV
jgi:hypothetical protein